MGPAFFRQWPELYADIPSFEAAAMAMDRMTLTDDARKRRDMMVPSEEHGTAFTNKPVTDSIVDGIDIDGMSQPISPQQGPLQEVCQVKEDDNGTGERDQPGEISQVQAYGQRSRQGSQFASAGKRRESHHFQHSGGNHSQYAHLLGGPANHRTDFSMPAAPALVSEISRIRGTELIPQHNWPWLTYGLADGRAMQEQEGGQGKGYHPE